MPLANDVRPKFVWLKPEPRSWRTRAQDCGGGLGGMWGETAAINRTQSRRFRVDRAAPNFAPAFGLRVLEHRFVPHGNEVTAWEYGYFHFGIRVKFQ